MNSSIYVQPSLGIPAGPITVGKQAGQKETQRKPVAAVIRPMPQQMGQKGILRADVAESKRHTPHIRKHSLDDYVNWLREKYQQDEKDTKPTVTETVETEIVEEPETVTNSTNELEPISLEYPSVFATQDSYYSLMMAKNYLDAATSPNPESVEGKEAIEETVNVAEPELAEPEANHFAPMKFSRVDEAHTPEKNLAQAHVSFAEAEQHEGPTISAHDTDAFIKAVSQAIASVLTEMPEPVFEERIRDHFATELHARAIESLKKSSDYSEVDQMDRTTLASLEQAGGKPVLTMQSEAEKVAAEILRDMQKEIPTTVAAWDVEDFRWPVVTSQMIVSSGAAIDNLTRSAMEMISPGNQRIAITGLSRGEGTTSIAISLARWAAASGNNVLLVDADITSPSLSSQVGLASNLSWVNAISQSQSPAEVIVRSQSSNLCIMPLADMVSRVTWPRFIYDNLGGLVDQVRGTFDVVILDMGPATQLLSELSRPDLLVDATLLVHDGVSSPELGHMKERLENFGIRKFVIAQNRTGQKSVNVA